MAARPLTCRIAGRAPVELEKEGRENGAYQHPEPYGQPPEMEVNYHATHERPPPAIPPEATPH